jgi:hypothetical protein
MTIAWRVLQDGEKQWRGADGNWYSSEEMALGARTTKAPPFPGIYTRPPKRRSRWLRPRPWIILGLLLGGLITFATIVGNDLQSPPYKVDMLTVHVLNPQQVDVEYRIHNLGTSPWQPSCVVSVLPIFGGGIGTARQSTYSPIDPGEYGDDGGIVTISNNDAQAVTVRDVQIDDC